MIRKPGKTAKYYAALLQRTRPQVITSQRQADRDLALTDGLLKVKKLSAAQGRLLELLSLLIERFEVERYGPSKADSVDVLRELMDARGMNQADLARFFGSKGVASEVLNRRRRISLNAARALAKHFSVPIDVFV